MFYKQKYHRQIRRQAISDETHFKYYIKYNSSAEINLF